MDWQPIETAPRWGVFVVCENDRPPIVAFRRISDEHPLLLAYTDIPIKSLSLVGYKPTHWMPVPPAPKDSK